MNHCGRLFILFSNKHKPIRYDQKTHMKIPSFYSIKMSSDEKIVNSIAILWTFLFTVVGLFVCFFCCSQAFPFGFIVALFSFLSFIECILPDNWFPILMVRALDLQEKMKNM